MKNTGSTGSSFWKSLGNKSGLHDQIGVWIDGEFQNPTMGCDMCGGTRPGKHKQGFIAWKKKKALAYRNVDHHIFAGGVFMERKTPHFKLKFCLDQECRRMFRPHCGRQVYCDRCSKKNTKKTNGIYFLKSVANAERQWRMPSYAEDILRPAR